MIAIKITVPNFFSVHILTFTNMVANYSSPEDSGSTDAESEDFHEVFYDNANQADGQVDSEDESQDAVDANGSDDTDNNPHCLQRLTDKCFPPLYHFLIQSSWHSTSSQKKMTPILDLNL